MHGRGICAPYALLPGSEEVEYGDPGEVVNGLV